MSKKKLSYTARRQKEAVNKKAIIWAGSIVVGIVVLMTILLIWNP
ncbi:MAG: hypothetical protein K0R67_3832 [Paenibacillus sp.]|jgi:hypothetical protein|nr:hypothetical protein [Paenibacillus sp.]